MARRPAAACWILGVALTLAGCGGEGTPAGRSPEATSPPRVATYPIRRVVVARGPGPSWPEAPQRTAEEARARARTAHDRLKAGEDFARVAGELSDDAFTREDGGFVGFVGRQLGEPEDMIRTIAALPEGGLSEPIESESGFVVLQRLSRAEGMAIEAKVTAAIEGFVVQWHELIPSLPPSQTREQAYAEAAAALTELRSGRTTPEQAAGRILGARPVSAGLRRRTDPRHAKVVEALLRVEPGAWADVTETKDGWLVARRLPYERFSLSHLLVTHDRSPGRLRNPDRTEAAAVTRAEEALARLRKDPASWDAVVREYSDDADTRADGGRLGDACNVELPTRRPPPEVEQAAAALRPGAISDVVPGRLGVHVLRRDP